LIFSQVLTLYITPVVYYYLDKVEAWLKRGEVKRAREEAEAERDPADAAVPATARVPASTSQH